MICSPRQLPDHDERAFLSLALRCRSAAERRSRGRASHARARHGSALAHFFSPCRVSGFRAAGKTVAASRQSTASSQRAKEKKKLRRGEVRLAPLTRRPRDAQQQLVTARLPSAVALTQFVPTSVRPVPQFAVGREV